MTPPPRARTAAMAASRGCRAGPTDRAVPADSAAGERYAPAIRQRTLIVSSGAPEGHVAQGIVKWFNSEKGYGFLAVDDGEELFVHYSGIEGDGYRSLE